MLPAEDPVRRPVPVQDLHHGVAGADLAGPGQKRDVGHQALIHSTRDILFPAFLERTGLGENFAVSFNTFAQLAVIIC